MPLSDRQRELCEQLGISPELVEDVVKTSSTPVCPKCEEAGDKCQCDLQEFPFGMGEAAQGPVSNAEMNRKKDIKAPNEIQNPAVQNYDPTRKSASQKEADREKKLRDKMADEVQDDMRQKHNTKKDDVTFYPSTDNQR
jgi:hypothetical protein